MSYRRLYVDGKILNIRTANMLTCAEQRLGYSLHVMQGSYNGGGVSASAGTHDGGGAVDVSFTSNPSEVVKALREVGFAAWHRLPSQGPWVEHIHAIAIGDAEMSSGAASQVRQYYNNTNGLASYARDDGPRYEPIPVWPIARPAISLGRAVNQFTVDHPHSVLASKRIQTLLNHRMGTNLLVDGVAGDVTRKAYKAWEKHINAGMQDGVPGKPSLKKLVEGYYRVVN